MSDIDTLKKEYDDLSQELTKTEVISDYKRLQEISKRHSKLREIINLKTKIEKLTQDISDNESILSQEQNTEMLEMAQEELNKLQKEKSKLEQELDNVLNPSSGTNINEAIVEIRAGVGGDEATLFAQDLFRMYARYAELQNWKVTVLEESKSELKGIKEIIIEIKGKDVYKKLKNESGVHRVQRIPETEKSGRLHTSSSSVAVLPKAKDIDIDIKPSDIKLETFRSSGPGGQNVNKVSTAVRITYLPTGLYVASQSSKSQAKNREIAMTLLRSRLLQTKRDEEEKKLKTERKEQIGSGDRSEKIRTYNFPQDRITDHRVNKSWHGINAIMNGALNPIFDEVDKQL
ncbi:MAG: peptide chain release factor 1 [Candidatus Spechtbacteria bacterium RIFCSPLOWO2_12_FULL_38_22]|uniref:Peptide chain release factor 1 n=1 Tax=Candidatus Spechtbacteria bacterium RIFCSPLOWO2_12_FULL_38_22 TaxID=1802165 RepID=A0A1G2HGN4_9BACT|nr:MAG: peptide chain release factor 1 [Candidatus Spechtbacteria bacterium RIFCSPHIGHO2_01_FULL_38_11]OGZ59653.1 MAG: peptide chain release factor 1 [Candidatus Spechtbacteria bacterium RIFCSPHIGHO2_12_FULL_38_30]OGZ61675.1 MAG: peptide chain release factor 1 [Candidatus Spechtbacteria bacterium RIFCSPLOWO2_12_FULL_38_22]